MFTSSYCEVHYEHILGVFQLNPSLFVSAHLYDFCTLWLSGNLVCSWEFPKKSGNFCHVYSVYSCGNRKEVSSLFDCDNNIKANTGIWYLVFSHQWKGQKNTNFWTFELWNALQKCYYLFIFYWLVDNTKAIFSVVLDNMNFLGPCM